MMNNTVNPISNTPDMPDEDASADQTLQTLLEVARASWELADNTAELDSKDLRCDYDDFNRLSKSLDKLDKLPDPPNEVATGPRKAEYQMTSRRVVPVASEDASAERQALADALKENAKLRQYSASIKLEYAQKQYRIETLEASLRNDAADYAKLRELAARLARKAYFWHYQALAIDPSEDIDDWYADAKKAWLL